MEVEWGVGIKKFWLWGGEVRKRLDWKRGEGEERWVNGVGRKRYNNEERKACWFIPVPKT